MDSQNMKKLKFYFAVAFAICCLSDIAFAAEMTAPVAGVRVGFALDRGVWRENKDKSRIFHEIEQVSHGSMSSLSVSTNGTRVTAIWKGHPKLGKNFTVRADMKLLPQGGFDYSSFTYAGNKDTAYISRIGFPLVVVPRTEKTALFIPKKVGEVFRPDWKKVRRGQMLFQTKDISYVFNCVAAIEDGGTSHYFDQRGESRRESTSLKMYTGMKSGTLVLRNSCDMPITEKTRLSGKLPYGGVYIPYRGGWYEAAKIRRAWLETTPWFKAACRRDFSKLREIALWMWGRGGVGQVEEPTRWFMRETGLKVALDWYWWHAIPYDTAYPYFWPPRDGEEAFRAAVKRLKEAGAFVQVYTNGMLWDCGDKRWNGDDDVVVEANGKNKVVVYNQFTKSREAHMCGEAPKFQGLMRRLEKTLAGTGLDGVYMDMISCATQGGRCFNPHHRHTPGGGTHRIDGYRDYVGKVIKDNPGFLLSSEAPSEAYVDLFDAFIVIYSSWERTFSGLLPVSQPVPAVSVIYRGAAVLFGSFATPSGLPPWDPKWGPSQDVPDVEKIVARYPDQFAVEFARGIVWGIQPLVHNFTMKDVANPRLADDIQFMKDAARFYFDNRDFLFDGEMLPPAKIDCGTARVSFLAAGSYVRPHQAPSFTQNALPAILHSQWRAPDGRQAAILANWTREKQKYAIDLGGKTYTGEISPRRLRKIEFK
jgi:hypothetical protein